jgi:hypothetical protein
LSALAGWIGAEYVLALWMLKRMDVAFGMRHQAKYVTLRVAYARDIANGAVRIIGIRYVLGRVLGEN